MTDYFINEAETIAYKSVSEGNHFFKKKGGTETKGENNVEFFRKMKMLSLKAKS
jgi:hypothetical protein